MERVVHSPLASLSTFGQWFAVLEKAYDVLHPCLYHFTASMYKFLSDKGDKLINSHVVFYCEHLMSLLY